MTDNTADQVTRLVYDGDGRLRFSVDALDYVTERTLDGSGNVTRTIQYAAVLAPASWSYADRLGRRGRRRDRRRPHQPGDL